MENSANEVASINGSIQELENQLSQLNSTLNSLSDILNDFVGMCGGIIACEERVPSVPNINSIDGVSRLLHAWLQ